MIRDVERFLTFFRIAVRAVLYEGDSAKAEALADLRKQITKVSLISDLSDSGIPTSFWLSSLGIVRSWHEARSPEEREALTDCTVRVVDALEKYVAGTLVPPRDAGAETARNIGGA